MYLLKMQRMKMGIIQFEMKGEEIRVFSDKEKAEAVSYTHLDVYKRQGVDVKI